MYVSVYLVFEACGTGNCLSLVSFFHACSLCNPTICPGVTFSFQTLGQDGQKISSAASVRVFQTSSLIEPYLLSTEHFLDYFIVKRQPSFLFEISKV